MGTIKRQFPWGTVMTLLGLVGLIFFSFFKPSISWTDAPPRDRPDFEFKDVKITQYQFDKPEFAIQAKLGTVDRDKDSVKLIEMTGRFYTPEGEFIEVSSPTASLSINGKAVVITDATVHLTVSEQPARLSTTELRWNGSQSRIQCYGGVTIQMPSYSLRGAQFDGRVPLQRFMMYHNARAEIIL